MLMLLPELLEALFFSHSRSSVSLCCEYLLAFVPSGVDRGYHFEMFRG